ncbi:hypothetical protein CH286_23265 [Rhodococcus sp. WWJCD1]|uniref:hypothetical protein n=1 Tax=Rhodococcus sp. WWJCD1 TaxID=2022519 RepID=UPI000B9BC9E2|nr:hypothetical protein [Rhodococcus sp. WWJCD1]OZC43164.1 hypothetical protein CH286_23265 [Rhodococcus sp. WWJCD1]
MDIERWRSRLPVKRASDGEVIGWTVAHSSSGSTPRDEHDEHDEGYLVDAVNPVGITVAQGVSLEYAIAALEERGLASLSWPHWTKAPLPLQLETDLLTPQDDWQWRRVLMTQLDDNRVWIRPAYPSWPERLLEIPLSIPADDILRPQSPADSD